MENFDYYQPTRYVFGRGAQSQTGELMAELSEAKRVLVVYDTDRIEKNGLLDEVTSSLEAAGFEWWTLSGIVPNPRIDLVYKGNDIVRENGIDCVLAIGGGSVMDTAKAIGAAAKYDGDCMDFATGTFIEDSLPVGVILTLAATGSEGAMFAVITVEMDGVLTKCGFMGDAIRPKFAIMNPELTFTVPKWQTACGTFDMMSHVMENYFSPSGNANLVDGMIEGILRAVRDAAVVVMEDPENYDARATLMWASTLCNNGMMGLGRISDTTPHALGESYGGAFDITHGASIAVSFMQFAENNLQKMPAKWARFAHRVWDVPATGDDLADGRAGIDALRAFVTDVLGIPLTLPELGVEPNPELAAQLAASIDVEEWNSVPGYCFTFTEDEIKAFFKAITE